MRALRKDILKIFITFFSHCKPSSPNYNSAFIIEKFIGPLQAILNDYEITICQIRECEIIMIYTKIFDNMSIHLG